MPFVDALIKEIVRIRPSSPLGQHFTTGEIRYKNFVVPKNTTILTNASTPTRSFMLIQIYLEGIDVVFHETDIFEEPDIFNPDRFIQFEYGTRPGMDIDFRDNFLFGSGRRICPGQYFARATMQLTAMRLTWTFKFQSTVDAQTGLPVERDLNFYAPEFVVRPRPFKCVIQPRSPQHRGVVMHASDGAQSILWRYEN
ncbi:cytochrome P450 [Mycena capillaripes]|nr:cytochrome P450 [Mycena capillaripes]